MSKASSKELNEYVTKGTLGLIINERVMNVPAEVAPKMHQLLFQEFQQFTEAQVQPLHCTFSIHTETTWVRSLFTTLLLLHPGEEEQSKETERRGLCGIFQAGGIRVQKGSFVRLISDSCSTAFFPFHTLESSKRRIKDQLWKLPSKRHERYLSSLNLAYQQFYVKLQNWFQLD